MRVGVVADDITGANDIGIMFAGSGYEAHVYPYDGASPLGRESEREPQALILNTSSRCDPAQTAYEKVFSATQELRDLRCERFINKTCSVFRGNIGAEFDGMLDALHEDFAVVVLGFPRNGRTTVRGIHYVYGQRLEESPFRYDPVHPMTRSNLVEILQSQTERRVASVGHETVAEGSEALRKRISDLRREYHYVILDVVDQDSLATIAQAVRDEKVVCGSSALAEELPGVWGGQRYEEQILDLPKTNALGILCAVGSLTPQTAAQVHHVAELGTPVFELDSVRILDPSERMTETKRLSRELAGRLRRGEDAVLRSASAAWAVEQTKAEGARKGLSETEVSRLVSATIGQIAAKAVELAGQNRLLVAGGETSAAVCEYLGVRGLSVWKEIQPGLPSCVSLSEPRRLLVLKSGSFGSPDFFVEALAHLRSQ